MRIFLLDFLNCISQSLFFLMFSFPLLCFANSSNNIKLFIPEKQISLFDDLILQASIDIPENYSIDEEELKNNLINIFTSYTAPFQLIDVEKVNNTWTFKLRPQYEGSFPITFWQIHFHPKNSQDLKQSILSPIEQVTVKIPSHSLKIPSLMPSLKLYSNTIPIEMDADNLLLMQTNQEEIFKQNLIKNKNNQFPLWETLIIILLLIFLYLSFLNEKEIKK